MVIPFAYGFMLLTHSRVYVLLHSLHITHTQYEETRCVLPCVSRLALKYVKTERDVIWHLSVLAAVLGTTYSENGEAISEL